MKTKLVLLILLALLLSACSPAAPGRPTLTPSISAVTASETPVVPTILPVITAEVGTAFVGESTSQPGEGTALPIPTSVPPTLIPTLPSGANPIELKYEVLGQFPDMFFCDPDFYPVARSNEADLARQRFPALLADTAGFQVILKHTGLSGLTTFSDDQKLLIYREHKKLDAIQFELAGNVYQFQLQTEDKNKQGYVIQGQIDGNGVITVQQSEPGIATCPICLAVHTQIDTPQGPVKVEDLRTGDVVWSVDAVGVRLPEAILVTMRTPVPTNHKMVHVVLEDDTELWASPGHPTSDGRWLGDLKVGDRLDGRRVIRLELEPYGQSYTYDLLPAGDTGFYWANGILMGSTLSKK